MSTCCGLVGLWWTADKLVGPLDEFTDALGVGFGALGVIVGAAALAVSWLGYRADRREHVGGLPIGDLADALALPVRGQWEAEAQLRRLNDPYPLPVSWQPADENLVEPWPLLLQVASRHAPQNQWAARPEDLVGTDTEITDILTRRAPGRRLLVLGEPGAGKTMLLVVLLLGLLDRRSPGDAVPVIFPLASWNPKQSLEAWMANRLTTDYPALSQHHTGYSGQNTARALLDNRLILPILDGLDELAPSSRSAALVAINAALPPGRPMVLSSRSTEYGQALRPGTGVPQRLNGAAGIVLEPLSLDTVASYLRRDAGGEGTLAADRWNPVLDRMTQGSPLATVLTTPLALFLARTIYNPRPDEAGPHLPNPAELCNTERILTESALRTHLLNAFIPAAYRPHSLHPCHWTPARAEHVLRKVANHLERRRHGTVDIVWWELRYALPAPVLTAVIGAMVGLLTLVLSAAGHAVVRFHSGGYYFFNGCGLLCDSWEGSWLSGFGTFPNFVANVLSIPPTDHVYPPWDWWQLFLDWPTGITSAFIYVTLGCLIGSVANLRSRVVPARRLHWSFNSRALALSLSCSLATGGLAGLGYGPLAGLSWATITFAICAITTGVTALPAEVQTAASPMTLLREDQRSFVQFLLVPVLAGGFLLGPGIALGYTAADALLDLNDHIMSAGSGIGFWAGCILGLALALNRTANGRFLLIRLYLILHWKLPWNVMAFFDDAHRHRGVLRQVGSAYQFRHLDLQRHLVALDVATPASPAVRAPSTASDPPS
ncbi:NACHT domain-containing protein [Streptomyces liliifuscus]|uniref:NACHT domain-containing protein n=1 Tax=Streptomyces liliifuscus TaxID=2797636 RepID=A0A7T7HZ63_9ACTN|nr:NACHT domain-containing protein [Streptomyces liliifuscus]QQM38056.1 NACHT domain-containing protein [Streptomyces liliifuscus]QQM46386.1 NACHT domain-containing protein [Streptomyces liliifuscus]